MKAATKITLTDDNGIKFFGEGPCRLLRCVEKTGSLRAAAMEMEMAYSKASKILKQAEENLGFLLTTRSTGGKDGGAEPVAHRLSGDEAIPHGLHLCGSRHHRAGKRQPYDGLHH